MDMTALDLITIIAEPVLEERITTELLRLGATGYTVADARGRGSRGMRTGDVPGSCIRVETVVSPRTAERILEHVRTLWFPDYAVIAWRSTVQVVRGDKYATPPP